MRGNSPVRHVDLQQQSPFEDVGHRNVPGPHLQVELLTKKVRKDTISQKLTTTQIIQNQ